MDTKVWIAKYKKLPEIEVKGKSTSEAGKNAARRYAEMGHHGIDDLLIDVREIEGVQGFSFDLGPIPDESFDDEEVTQPNAQNPFQNWGIDIGLGTD